MGMNLRILGSSSATPTASRHPSAQLLNVNERLFLIDCGEGTQIQMRRFKIRSHRIQHIFISHLHGDHYLGLPGLIFTMHLFGRKEDLHIYANPALKEILDLHIKVSETQLLYPLHFHPLIPGEASQVFSNNNVEVTAFPLMHRVPTHGFVFREKCSDRRIIKEAVADLHISSDLFNDLKKGNDLVLPDGRIIPNAQLTRSPRHPKSYAYCSDTGYTETIIPFIRDVDVLYHEATFMNERVANAREKLHSTTTDAATIALKAGVGKLIIGHYSARYDELEPVLEETRATFPESYLAEEGMIFEF
jgi:ribonuclease Z